MKTENLQNRQHIFLRKSENVDFRQDTNNKGKNKCEKRETLTLSL